MKQRFEKPLRNEADALATRLRRKIKGEVRFDEGSRALYATDSSNYRQVPIGIIIPHDEEDVIETVALCREFDAPITCRGGATSLAGQCCNVAVILDFSKYMNRVIDLDPVSKLARVQAGVVLDHLQDAAKPFQLRFGPDPSTHQWCTIGGMIGNNACGVHSAMGQFYGNGARTSDQVVELDILTYDGCRMTVGPTNDLQFAEIIRRGGRPAEIYKHLKAFRDKYADLIRQRVPKLPRKVSGYAVNQLLPENGFNVARALVGTEGTCATVLQATVHLLHKPSVTYLLLLGYPDIYTAGDAVAEISKFKPTGLEGIDDVLIDNMRSRGLHVEDLPILPEGNGWLLVEIGADSHREADEKSREMIEALKRNGDSPNIKLLKQQSEQQKIWEIRESSLGATAHRGPDDDAWEGWEDSAVPPEKLGQYLRDLRGLFNKYGYACSLYGHFAGGCVHTRIDFGLKTKDGIKKYRDFVHEAAHLVVSHGGSLSGEHGDGQSRAEMMPIMYGHEMVRAFEEFKAIWDPQNKMNPRKVVHPYRVDENLRYGADYNPPQLETHFKYPNDHGSFPYAMERCVGVGKCRREEDGTMCPSYMVTKEEKHTTRGRARLLWEMLNGDVLKSGWRSDEVKESLDLCLACKGCKSDCPVHVDMATYKAEFFAHYYKGRLRPSSAYAMGLIYWWARMASQMPKVANFFTQSRPFSSLMKVSGGIAPERKMPKFAEETFRAWFGKRTPRNKGKAKVLLWPDTFTNFFHPDIGKAAVAVLEAAGFHVIIPEKMLCCGRPLYDFGMLKTAKHLLQQVLDNLHDEIAEGIPVVGLEPSCVSVFREELRGLFHMVEDARRLQENTYTLSEFLEKKAPHFQIPKLHREAIIQGHCHHKAIMKMHCEEKVLEKMGLDFEILDSGCCGMAGSFGFEKEKYDVSVACGERVLLPRVRQADETTLVIADGFSCREQISQLAGRKALHTAQVLQMGLREDATERAKDRKTPIQTNRFYPAKPRRSFVEVAANAVGATVGAVAGIFSFLWNRKSRH
ncbi:MAG: FAD-binding protein [Verrucomicrobia bacterium]|nr:FAD-binding protein [Verrucomicrobiota bacterium]